MKDAKPTKYFLQCLGWNNLSEKSNQIYSSTCQNHKKKYPHITEFWISDIPLQAKIASSIYFSLSLSFMTWNLTKTRPIEFTPEEQTTYTRPHPSKLCISSNPGKLLVRIKPKNMFGSTSHPKPPTDCTLKSASSIYFYLFEIKTY